LATSRPIDDLEIAFCDLKIEVAKKRAAIDD
jgi:hypothetical protein